MKNDDTNQDSGDFEVPTIVYWLGAPFLWSAMAAERYLGLYKPLEKQCINSLLRSMSRDTSRLLEQQLNEINHALRTTTKSTEVVFYRIAGARPIKVTRSPLPIGNGDINFAKLKAIVDKKTMLNVGFWAIDGRFMSMEFNQDTRRIGHAPSIEVSIEWLHEALR